VTAASPGPGPSLFSFLTHESLLPRTRRETFALSFFGQSAVLAVIIYFTGWAIHYPPAAVPGSHHPVLLPLTFPGLNGGGGGDLDPLPASAGAPPPASLDVQIVPPNVIVLKQPSKLEVDQTVIMAPDIKFPPGQIGDPSSEFTKSLSNGSGGPGGIGNDGCCGGVGSSSGPYVGNGPPGIVPLGKGVTAPQVIFNPEPTFSDEARKSKTQGRVTLSLVVGKDGLPYDIRVRESLGMGLDEKAIEAVNRWRFRPATLNGQPVATRVDVEVDFHLY
jgi:periplasmic protein TonB